MLKNRDALEKTLRLLPRALASEILALSHGMSAVNEIRIRRMGRSSLFCAGRIIPLSYSARESIDAIFSAVCLGTPYAFRDSVCRGFVPLSDGVRVGVVGRARYEGGELLGISEVSSLVFRLPTVGCDFGDELFEIWERGRGGLLIFSPPGGGKTTALRSLIRRLGVGERALRVAVVDEREEIFTDELSGIEADFLSGYRRALGISIAVRTLSPDVIVTDEISGEDATALSSCALLGVPVIATAHAGSLRELLCRLDMRELLGAGAFTRYAHLRREGGRFLCREEYIENE